MEYCAPTPPAAQGGSRRGAAEGSRQGPGVVPGRAEPGEPRRAGRSPLELRRARRSALAFFRWLPGSLMTMQAAAMARAEAGVESRLREVSRGRPERSGPVLRVVVCRGISEAHGCESSAFLTPADVRVREQKGDDR